MELQMTWLLALLKQTDLLSLNVLTSWLPLRTLSLATSPEKNVY